MKKALVCIFVFIFILSSFAIYSFASHLDAPNTFVNQPLTEEFIVANQNGEGGIYQLIVSDNPSYNVYCFSHPFRNNYGRFTLVSENNTSVFIKALFEDGSVAWNTSYTLSNYNSTLNLYYFDGFGNPNNVDGFTYYVPVFDTLDLGLNAVRSFIDNPPSQYTKNEYVDEFLANTLISMGFTFNTEQEALNAGSAVWDWAIDENNITEGYMSYDVDTFVSYCNAQSNNYINWYQGYRVHSDVTSAIAHYIYSNRSLSGWNGFTYKDFDSSYSPVIRYGTGFNANVEKGENAFYPAQTYTYVNGEYITSEGVDGRQFLYLPADVRRFISNPSAPVVNPEPPSSGTGVITDGNGDTVYNIDIDFPPLDWLASAIQSILDFFKKLLDTISTLLSKVIDTLERLLSDVFESLSVFGQGILEFIQTFITRLITYSEGFIPTPIFNAIGVFLALHIGIGLLLFVLRSH